VVAAAIVAAIDQHPAHVHLADLAEGWRDSLAHGMGRKPIGRAWALMNALLFR